MVGHDPTGVKGVPITAYCDQNQLTLRQRLELLRSDGEATLPVGPLAFALFVREKV